MRLARGCALTSILRDANQRSREEGKEAGIRGTGPLAIFAFPVTGRGENKISSLYVTGLSQWEFGRTFFFFSFKKGERKEKHIIHR